MIVETMKWFWIHQILKFRGKNLCFQYLDPLKFLTCVLKTSGHINTVTQTFTKAKRNIHKYKNLNLKTSISVLFYFQRIVVPKKRLLPLENS